MATMQCTEKGFAVQVFVAEGGPEEWTLEGIVWKSKDGAS